MNKKTLIKVCYVLSFLISLFAWCSLFYIAVCGLLGLAPVLLTDSLATLFFISIILSVGYTMLNSLYNSFKMIPNSNE